MEGKGRSDPIEIAFRLNLLFWAAIFAPIKPLSSLAFTVLLLTLYVEDYLKLNKKE